MGVFWWSTFDFVVINAEAGLTKRKTPDTIFKSCRACVLQKLMMLQTTENSDHYR